ncbi:acyltransferase family protein [Actinomadura harenae]|uniref:Acyltransferase n=1 Tax=Actinomadura harenae TaxID=2483351 RepID=A0A3M2M5A8_9ACTN|nr:acyltransferase [Actinomadura harenae]RMI44944.1 acyltransferase [Actinomadura harenae]
MTESATQSTRRLHSLTGLRAVAAGFVLFAHAFFIPLHYTNGAAQKAAGALLPLATAAVSLFFILSGTVLTWSSRESDTRAQFWRRRMVRIYSNHSMAWILAVFLIATCGSHATFIVADHASFDITSKVADLLLLQSWIPVRDHVPFVANPPTWSLACEVFFYALFPFLLPGIRRIPSRYLAPASAFAVAICLSVPCVALMIDGPGSTPDAPLPLGQIWFAYTLPLARLPEFILGTLGARMLQEGIWPQVPLRYGIGLLLAAMAMLAFLPPIFAFGPYFALPMLLIVAGTASRELHGAPSFLHHPVMRYLGDRSYALYIIHYVVIMYLFRFVFGWDAAFNILGATACSLFLIIPSSLAAAWLLHRYVERLAMARLSGRPTATSSAETTSQ